MWWDYGIFRHASPHLATENSISKNIAGTCLIKYDPCMSRHHLLKTVLLYVPLNLRNDTQSSGSTLTLNHCKQVPDYVRGKRLTQLTVVSGHTEVMLKVTGICSTLPHLKVIGWRRGLRALKIKMLTPGGATCPRRHSRRGSHLYSIQTREPGQSHQKED